MSGEMTAEYLRQRLPGFQHNVNVVGLGSFPTPIIHLKNLGTSLGCENLYLKQDGNCGKLYGGNKVRKLEFLFGEALRKKAKEVITFGYAGSNHGLATAVYAKELGLKCTLILLPQIKAPYVRKNLLYDLAAGAAMQGVGSEKQLFLAALKKMIQGRLRTGFFPYIIPPGGSSAIGSLGYVNGALELQRQVFEGIMPEPDYLYVPLGTMGTAAGLIVGLKLAGMKTKVICTQVVKKKLANIHKLNRLINKTAQKLREVDGASPDLHFSGQEYEIRTEFFGGRYALVTEQAKKACSMAKELEEVQLEGTYTGKAMAALINDVRENNNMQKKNILFWGTYNTVSFDRLIESLDYKQLPISFHKYFENEIP